MVPGVGGGVPGVTWVVLPRDQRAEVQGSEVKLTRKRKGRCFKAQLWAGNLHICFAFGLIAGFYIEAGIIIVSHDETEAPGG